jgi:GT2 family glycosyltransferase
MNRPKAVFIVVSWNNADLLEECFDSISKQTYKNHKTILVDNGSGDNSIEIARKTMPEVEVIAAGQNLGFAKGNNRGIKKALEDEEVGFVVLLNSDARVAPDWLGTIIDFSALKPRAACLQGTTLDYYNHNIVDSTHIYISRIGQAIQANHREYYEEEFGPRKVFGVNAAACVITREFIEAQPFGTEFFDETMFMYLEDVDVAARATVMGWDNYLVPSARAYHMGSASSGKNPSFSLYMTFRNNLGLNIKNLPLPILARVVVSIFKADRASIRHLKLIGKPEGVKAIIKGRIIGMFFIPIFIYKRLRLRKYREIDREYLWQLMKKGY